MLFKITAYLAPVTIPKATIALVTPVWNDSARLGEFGPELTKALTESGLSVRWIVADDGSSMAEKRRLEKLVDRFKQEYSDIELLLSEERSRKGGAIYRAWDTSVDMEVLAFVDADGAIDAGSTVRLLRAGLEAAEDTAVIGIRSSGSGMPIHRTLGRMLSSKAFRYIVRILLGLGYQDTQCGIKVIPGSAYRAIQSNLSEKGFIFDLELLIALKARSVRIREEPIAWKEVAGSKLNPLRDIWAMLAGLLRVRKRMQSGIYNAP